MCPFLFLIEVDDERFCWTIFLKHLFFLPVILSVLSHLVCCNDWKLQSSRASSQNPLNGCAALPTALRDFCLLKIIIAFYGLCLSKVWDLPAALLLSLNIHLYINYRVFSSHAFLVFFELIANLLLSWITLSLLCQSHNRYEFCIQ